jgi:AcrR family transcriptional regulator
MNTDLATQRRSEIIMAAGKLFAEKGYHSTNISDIAAELDMGHGTFYRYFQNKLDIFVNVISDIIGRVSVVVVTEKAEDAATLEDYRKQLYRIGDGLVGIMEREPVAARILFYESLGIDEQINDMVHKAFELFGAYTQSYLENGKRRGFLRGDLHTREAALAVNSMLLEAARRIVLSDDLDGAKKVWIKTIIDIMLEGMKAS